MRARVCVRATSDTRGNVARDCDVCSHLPIRLPLPRTTPAKRLAALFRYVTMTQLLHSIHPEERETRTQQALRLFQNIIMFLHLFLAKREGERGVPNSKNAIMNFPN